MSSGFARSVAALASKHGRLVARDPTLYLSRFVVLLVGCSFFAVLYIEARRRTQAQVRIRRAPRLSAVGDERPPPPSRR